MFRPPKCEAPKLGEAFTRDDSDLGKEHALIVYVRVRGDHWDALLLTDNGHHPLSSSDFVVPRQHANWRPATWVWDEVMFLFRPDGLKWVQDGRSGRWEGAPKKKAKDPNALPAVSEIPKPNVGEHHGTWRARCRRKFPALKSEEGDRMLGRLWDKFKSAAA
jgi:hypothetical protein